jgi:hypothetical protein
MLTMMTMPAPTQTSEAVTCFCQMSSLAGSRGGAVLCGAAVMKGDA